MAGDCGRPKGIIMLSNMVATDLTAFTRVLL